MSGNDPLSSWLADAWAATPETFDIDVEATNIHFRAWNLAADDMPGIVLVHGFRAHSRWWDHVAPSLASAGYRVAALDLSGMGDSGRREHYSREQHGREILAVAQECGFERPVIISHSFGSMGALIACRNAPQRIGRAIIIDSAIPIQKDGTHRITLPPSRAYPSAEDALARFRLVPPGKWPNPEILAYIARHSLTETPDGWRWKFDEQMADTLNEEPYREKMFGVRVPCDVVYGANSEIMSPARRAQLREMADNCGLDVEIPAAHHHIMIEQPLALVAALKGLLARAPEAGFN